jgi:dCTP deaminase
MILSDKDILTAIQNGRVRVDPIPDVSMFSTCSLDLRLGDQFWKYKPDRPGVDITIDFDAIRKAPHRYDVLADFLEEIRPDKIGSIVLEPKTFLLCPTLEYVNLPIDGQLMARIEGRSSLARLAISVHMTAPIIHNGFSGRIYLEIFNHGPLNVRLWPRTTCVCQLLFEELSSKPSGKLDTIFIDQNRPTGK